MRCWCRSRVYVAWICCAHVSATILRRGPHEVDLAGQPRQQQLLREAAALSHDVLKPTKSALRNRSAGDALRSVVESQPVEAVLGKTQRFGTVTVLDGPQTDRFPDNFGDCALVGSSEVLAGAGRGREIDAHDTVIRINRLPRLKDKRDFGRRTDVVYLNKVLSAAGNVSYLGGENVTCVHGGHRCRFKYVVIKMEKHKTILWHDAPFAVATQSLGIRNLTRGLSGLQGIIASSGLQAFLTFVPMCEQMTVYGFGGAAGTADGHHVGEQHNFEVENVLIDRMVSQTMLDSEWQRGHDFPTGAYRKWLREQIVDKAPAIRVVRD